MSPRAPRGDEVEITVIGPGFGESVLVHVGAGEWVIADSCIDRETDSPASLSYLRSIGVDPTTAVRLVVISHWHDDHIRGMRGTVEVCRAARIFCSTAMHDSEISVLAGASMRQGTLSTSAVAEFAGVLNALQTGPTQRELERALEDRILLARPAASNVPDAEVRSMSPSSAAVNDAIAALANFVEPVTNNLRLTPLDPNDASVALWVRVGEVCLLLGSDLEHGLPGGRKGWAAALTTTVALHEPKSCVVKIPHHGSADSHHDGMWTDLLSSQPTSVVTPYTRLSDPLPRLRDRERIRERSAIAHITSTGARRRARHDRTVEKTIRESVRWIVEAEPPLGRVTLRAATPSQSPTWTTDAPAPAELL